MISDTLIALLVGVTLDTLLGDPRWLFHPICFFGNIIAAAEVYFNQGARRKLKGAAVGIVLVLLTWISFYFLRSLCEEYVGLLIAFDSLIVFYALGSHSLITEVWKVERELMLNDLEGARKALSMIVGRDTSQLSVQRIRMAMLETLSENLSDGVIAPLFYWCVGGTPLMMAYKMINTLDSMVGYKSERYRDFGCFSAKLDDVANYIPARLTAFLMWITHPKLRTLRIIIEDGRNHASPNSGYPESALAGILDCRFGGPNVYHGELMEKPYIGRNERLLEHADVVKSCFVNGLSTLLFVIVIVAIICLLHRGLLIDYAVDLYYFFK